VTDEPNSAVRTSYDRVADEYVVRIAGELEHKPLDRQLLDRFAEKVRALGPVCDVGCGPGHVARYLHERGVLIQGVDLSPVMVAAARTLNPEIEFTPGDMRALPIADGALGGIVALYSIIHIPRVELSAVLTEMKRTLGPGGLLLLAFHIGDTTLHLDEWWGQRVSVDFFFFPTEEVVRFVERAGFGIVEVIEREPYVGVEHPSRRAYVLAEKPNDSLAARAGGK
jgi:SAM-dependent methyltransferase